MTVKKVHFFDYQFLKVHDFQAEQDYHVEMRRRHHRLLHGWGVVDGLLVGSGGQREIVIEPGMAIDNQGREIVILSPVAHKLVAVEPNTSVFVMLAYAETYDEADRYSSGGIVNHTRVSESHKVEEGREATQDGSVITLARVHLNANGHISKVDTSVRSLLPKRGSALGWVRLTFKPVRLEHMELQGRFSRAEKWDPLIEWIIDVGSAHCGNEGARGTMQIPVPPGASRVTHLRICGTAQQRLVIEWVRAGWNKEENRGDHKTLHKIDRKPEHEHFDENLEVTEDLQQLSDSHTLAISVIAQGSATIWLVAARFE